MMWYSYSFLVAAVPAGAEDERRVVYAVVFLFFFAAHDFRPRRLLPERGRSKPGAFAP